jgi:hypothetical protein
VAGQLVEETRQVGAELAHEPLATWQKLSKVTALIYLLWEVTKESTSSELVPAMMSASIDSSSICACRFSDASLMIFL